MRGMHQMNRMFFFLFRGHAQTTQAHELRKARVKAAGQTPAVQAFWKGIEEIQNGEYDVSNEPNGGYRSKSASRSTVLRPEPAQAGDGTDGPSVPVPSGDSAGRAVTPGTLYFYADGILHDNIPSYEALEHELSLLDPSAQVSEVMKHD